MTETHRVYKLTESDLITFGGTHWPKASTRHEAEPGDGPLCSRYWLHAYESKYVAAITNPIDANFRDPRCFAARGEGPLRREGHRLGVKALTRGRKVKLPEYTTDQLVAAAIFCAQEVYDDEEWNSWADDWLSGKDRSVAAARKAARDASWAIRAATRAEWAAREAAVAAVAARDWVSAAREAAVAAAWAVRAAAWAVRDAIRAQPELDLHRLAVKAHRWQGGA